MELRSKRAHYLLSLWEGPWTLRLHGLLWQGTREVVRAFSAKSGDDCDMWVDVLIDGPLIAWEYVTAPSYAEEGDDDQAERAAALYREISRRVEAYTLVDPRKELTAHEIGEDAFDFDLTPLKPCGRCEATGMVKPTTSAPCPDCEGEGLLYFERGAHQYEVDCANCDGGGEFHVPDSAGEPVACEDCRGTGFEINASGSACVAGVGVNRWALAMLIDLDADINAVPVRIGSVDGKEQEVRMVAARVGENRWAALAPVHLNAGEQDPSWSWNPKTAWRAR